MALITPAAQAVLNRLSLFVNDPQFFQDFEVARFDLKDTAALQRIKNKAPGLLLAFDNLSAQEKAEATIPFENAARAAIT